MNLEKLFNAKAYRVSKKPTFLSGFFNYFSPPKKQNKFWVTAGNNLQAAIRTVGIHTNRSEEQVLNDAINIGIAAMEEIVTKQAKYYRTNENGILEELSLGNPEENK